MSNEAGPWHEASETEDSAISASQGSAEEERIRILNDGYVCPRESGRAWREAWEAGGDMALIEDAMRLSPRERLRMHQRSLNLVLSLAQSQTSNDSRS